MVLVEEQTNSSKLELLAVICAVEGYLEMRDRGIVYNRNMYLKKRMITISIVHIRTLAASRYN